MTQRGFVVVTMTHGWSENWCIYSSDYCAWSVSVQAQFQVARLLWAAVCSLSGHALKIVTNLSKFGSSLSPTTPSKNEGNSHNPQTTEIKTQFIKKIFHQEVVGDGPHAFMRQDNPDDHHVSNHRHRNDAAVGGGPEWDLPHRLDELVECFAVV